MNMDSNQDYPIITSKLLWKSENYSPLLCSEEMIWAKGAFIHNCRSMHHLTVWLPSDDSKFQLDTNAAQSDREQNNHCIY